MHSFLDHDGILAFAHRGDHRSGPENTLPAFAGAVDLGYRYLETDTHCSRDGVLLAFHDTRLDRVTNAKGLLGSLDYSEIQKARVHQTETIPKLEDLIGQFPETCFNIDLKADSTVRPFLKMVQRLRCESRICVGSFSSERVAAVRTALPGLCTSLTPKEVLYARLKSFRIPAPKIRGLCAQVPIRSGNVTIVDARFLAAMKGLKIQTHVWTINDSDSMNHLIALGVEGIMTDEAKVLKTVLIANDVWADPPNLQ